MDLKIVCRKEPGKLFFTPGESGPTHLDLYLTHGKFPGPASRSDLGTALDLWVLSNFYGLGKSDIVEVRSYPESPVIRIEWIRIIVPKQVEIRINRRGEIIFLAEELLRREIAELRQGKQDLTVFIPACFLVESLQYLLWGFIEALFQVAAMKNLQGRRTENSLVEYVGVDLVVGLLHPNPLYPYRHTTPSHYCSQHRKQ
jgi:hypothetical protein